MDWDDRLADGVRQLGPDDAGELLTLQLAAWVREGRQNASFEIPPLREGLPEVRAALTDPDWTVWGYREASGRLLATARTRITAPGVALLGRLGIVPDRFGEGLGSAMLRLAESRLAPDVTRIELVTGLGSVDNHAFYHRHGYAVVGRDDVDGVLRLAKRR